MVIIKSSKADVCVYMLAFLINPFIKVRDTDEMTAFKLNFKLFLAFLL